MELNIGKKIAEFRKVKAASQEQLADFAGVSVAAVSKWETGSSYPDITLLPAIAEFFGVSIDVLMGYAVTANDFEEVRRRANAYDGTGDFGAGIPFIEKALKKYPDDFNMTLALAGLKLGKGTSSVPANKVCVLESIALYQKSKALIPPGSGSGFNWIDHQIAFAYGSIGEYGTAINILTKAGEERYALDIAGFMKKQGRFDEAKERLQKKLWDTVFTFAANTLWLAECFEREGDKASALSLYELNAEFTRHFTRSDKSCYCDLMCGWNFSDLAKQYQKAGSADKALEALKIATKHAVKFDRDPSYRTLDIAFMDGLTGYISNSSAGQACAPLIRTLETDFPALTGDESYQNMLADLKAEAKSKTESGIWESEK